VLSLPIGPTFSAADALRVSRAVRTVCADLG
jgi:hypothetical protein